MTVKQIHFSSLSLFYSSLGLNLNEDELPSQMDVSQWPNLKEKFAKSFASKTRSEWCEVFAHLDACVTPVLTLEEAAEFSHNRERKTFVKHEENFEPVPAPRLSRTPGDVEGKVAPRLGTHTVEVLLEAGFSAAEINELLKEEVVDDPSAKASL